MTPAEFTIALAACGLNDQQAAELFGVRDRTIRYWRDGGRAIPVEVTAAIANLDDAIDQAVDRAAHALPDLPAEGEEPEIVLLAYRSDADLKRYRPEDMKFFRFASVHRAFLARASREFEIEGYRVRITWLDPEAYETWRKAEGRRDSDDTRAAWAGLQFAA